MEILDKLFGSAAKVKIMRMFLFNQGAAYDIQQIAERVDVSTSSARKEVQLLERIGFLKRRIYFKEIEHRRGKKTTVTRRRTQGWALEPKFPYASLLHGVLVNTSLVRHKDIIKKLNGCGRIKLVVLSGVFIHDPESRVDVLVVGDKLRRSAIETVMKGLETSLGKELKYAAFETQDFQYRMSMYDKLIRDILDFKHEIIIDRLGLTPSKRIERHFLAS